MEQTTTFSVRMDADVKKQLDEFCNNVGMNTTTAINMFARAVLREKRLPFDVVANPDIFPKESSYPRNAYYDIFGLSAVGEKVNLLPNAEDVLEQTLENALKTISLQSWQEEDDLKKMNGYLTTQEVAEMFMLRYREGMTLREIADHCGHFTGDIEENEDNVQKLITKTLRLLRHPNHSKKLRSNLEL